MSWSKAELKYYAEYVKLTNEKFFDYFTSISDEEFEEEMVAVLLKLMVYNKKVVLYKTFSKEKVDIINFNEIDNLPFGYSWVPPNFAEVKNYLDFVDCLELDEESGEMKLNI